MSALSKAKLSRKEDYNKNFNRWQIISLAFAGANLSKYLARVILLRLDFASVLSLSL